MPLPFLVRPVSARSWGEIPEVARQREDEYYSLIKTSQSFRSDLCKTALSSLLGVSQAARRLVLRKSSSEIFVSF